MRVITTDKWNNVISDIEVDVPEAPPSVEDRLATVESELRGIKDRAAAATVLDDTLRDAVVGPSPVPRPTTKSARAKTLATRTGPYLAAGALTLDVLARTIL